MIDNRGRQIPLKVCIACGEELPFTSVYFMPKEDTTLGLSNQCRICTHIKRKIWRHKNKERINRDIRENMTEEQRQVHRDAHDRWVEANPVKYAEIQKISKLKKPELYRALTIKSRRKNWPIRYYGDIWFRLKNQISGRIYRVLKGIGKSAHTLELLGCTSDEFLKHMELQFKEGMSWNNYGQDGWVMDHIIPCAKFNLEDPLEQKKCFHYTNLQPLWRKENTMKSSIHDGKLYHRNKIIILKNTNTKEYATN